MIGAKQLGRCKDLILAHQENSLNPYKLIYKGDVIFSCGNFNDLESRFLAETFFRYGELLVRTNKLAKW